MKRNPVDLLETPHDLTRVSNARRYRLKLRGKRLLYRWFGELYVGKRVKLTYFRHWLRRWDWLSRADILEVGSGDGLFTFYLAHRYPQARITGLELNVLEAEACEAEARRGRTANLNFLSGYLHTQGWQERFRLIYCLDVLEHVRDDVGLLRDMAAALQPGGQLLLHVPNRRYLEIDGTLHNVPDEEAWRINPGHVRSGYSPEALERVVTQAGLSVQQVRQTQGYWVALAQWVHARIERNYVLRLLVLPFIDLCAWLDARQPLSHGNTVWLQARRPD